MVIRAFLKFGIAVLVILIASSVAFGYDFGVIWNTWTYTYDYHITENLSGYTVIAENYSLPGGCTNNQVLKCQDNVFIAGSDAQGAGGGTGYWYVDGSYLAPNTSATGGVDAVEVGDIHSDDWTNGSFTASQVTDFNGTSKEVCTIYNESDLIPTHTGNLTDDMNYQNATEVNSSIDEKVDQSFIEALGFVIATTIKAWISGNHTDLEDRKLNITDQRFNNSGYIAAVNNSDNINDLFTDDLTTDDQNTSENMQDATFSAVVGTKGINATYDDTGNQLIIQANATVCADGNYSYWNGSVWGCRGDIDTDTVGGGGELNATYNNTFGAIRGFSSSTYNGNFSNNSHIGYDRSDAICDSEYSGSHFCLCAEILKANVNGINHAVEAWCANGPPGYPAAANDCEGHTAVTDEVGAYWDYNENTGDGAGKLTVCSSTIKLACCGG